MFQATDLRALMPNPRLIVIDDDPGVSDVIAEHARKLNIDVVLATDGKEGLDAIYRTNPDVVLTDLKMPRMRGDELLMELNRLGYPKPVIIMTGFDATEVALRSLRYRLFDILEKPFVSERLNATLRKAFETEHHRRLQQELMTAALSMLVSLSPSAPSHEIMMKLEASAREAFARSRT